jgi:hypothetical protein
MTFEKHLDNLLVHILRTIAADGTVASHDRDIANLLVETAADRKRTSIVTDKKGQEAPADIDAIIRQFGSAAKKTAGGPRLELGHLLTKGLGAFRPRIDPSLNQISKQLLRARSGVPSLTGLPTPSNKVTGGVGMDKRNTYRR